MERHSTSFGAGDKQQHTLAGEVCFEGVTLHKGFHGKLLIKPALSNHGIVFKRTDLKASENLVRARWITFLTPHYAPQYLMKVVLVYQQ